MAYTELRGSGNEGLGSASCPHGCSWTDILGVYGADVGSFDGGKECRTGRPPDVVCDGALVWLDNCISLG